MNNSVGNIIRVIGKVIIGIGVIASIIVWIAVAEEFSGMVGFGAAIGTFVGTIVSGMIFIGFSEIIFLLEDIKNKHTTAIKEENITPITENLTKNNDLKSDYKPKHLFRCANCGKMIEGYPCRECGFNFN